VNYLLSSGKYRAVDIRIVFWCLLFFFPVTAYKALAQVKYTFTKDTLGIKGGETFSNFLKVNNPYTEDIALVQDSMSKQLIRGLLFLPDTLLLKAGESRVFPLKYLADRQTITSNIQVFTVHLLALKPGIQVQPSAAFKAILTDVSGLTIGTEEDEVYLSQLTNQVQVVVRCANNGFVPLTFRILLTGIPDGLEFTGQPMNLTLQPGSQVLLPFLARNKASNTAVDFTVTMQAMDESNHQLAVKVIRILNVTSARRMSSSGNQQGGVLPNTVSIHYASLNRGSSFYQLQANGKVNVGQSSTFEYRLNADDYHQAGANGINLYNSYLDYQTKKWGLRIGNIYDNLDFQLAGKGVKASAKLDDQGVLSFYGIQNNYFIYNGLNNTAPGGKVYVLDYDLETAGTAKRITFLHSSDPVTGLNADQFSMKSAFKPSKNETFAFEGGYSLESLRDGTPSAKQGFSAGLSYTLRTDGVQISGNGYYSNPYFTGLRRGLFLTDLRLTTRISETGSLVAHVNTQANNPKYRSRLIPIFDLGINKNSINIYELAYNFRAGRIYLNIGPYYMDQHLVSNGFSELVPMPVDWTSRSFRMAANIGYSGTVSSFSLTADYGYTFLNTSEKPPAPFQSVKITGSYNMPVFGLTSYLQFNPFYLSDALSTTEEQRYRLYSIGPNLHFNVFKNSLSFQFGGMYNYYGFTSSNNYSANGSFRYLMKGHWAITGDAQYILTKQDMVPLLYNPELNTTSSFDRQSYNNRQLRLGIEKQFGRQGNSGSKKLTLAYYEDQNSNGQRDPGEAPVAGVLVKINNDAALTNSKGEVTFSDMKKEAYTATVTNTKGWSLQEPTSVFLDKNKQIAVPLVKTQALNGCIKPIASKYLNAQPALAGIRVTAVDAGGRKHQTLTGERGEFCFYLPRNNYTVYVETEGMPFSIENGKEEVSLTGTPVALLTFLYKDEHRKVGVTRF
jgi:hypothetical protein